MLAAEASTGPEAAHALRAVCRSCLRQMRRSLDQTRARAGPLLPEVEVGHQGEFQGEEEAEMYRTTRDVCMTLESLLSDLEALEPSQESMLLQVNATLLKHFKDANLSPEALLDRDALGKALHQLLAVVRQYGSYLMVNEHPQLQSSIREFARDVDLGRESL